MTSAPSPSSGMSIDPAVLIGTAGVIDAEADVVANAALRLTDQLATLGPCWGDDPVGARFAAGYLPVADRVGANIAALAVGLVRIAAALRAVGERYLDVERSLVSEIDAVAASAAWPSAALTSK